MPNLGDYRRPKTLLAMTTSRILSLAATLLFTLAASAISPSTQQLSDTVTSDSTVVHNRPRHHEVHTDRVKAHSTDVYTVTVRGGVEAWVYVSGDGDTDLDVLVYDENGNFVCDDEGCDGWGCTFTPHWTGKYKIKVVNKGNDYNEYRITTSAW